ncbi:MAG TPA: hypothetical protein VHV47_14240 [Opitutaceae bacterium]|jgi:PleD family two-component response regulator|nr:hypothetical protein [Opitutaceae bacterium]
MKVLLLGFEVWDAGRIGHTLARLGHEPVAAADADEAVEMIDTDSSIRVAIADGRVPNFEWHRFCSLLREDRVRSQVYTLLVEDPAEDASHEDWAAEMGVSDFIERLDDPRELKRRLRVAERSVIEFA